jgi:hypothetical protein
MRSSDVLASVATEIAGPVSGLPAEAGSTDGITRYQGLHGLRVTGILDAATTLEVLGSDSERPVSKYRNRIDLKATPVAMKGDLMRLINGPASTRQGGR